MNLPTEVVEGTETDAVAELALIAAEIEEHDGLLVGHASRLHTVDLESFQDRPRRPSGGTTIDRVDHIPVVLDRWRVAAESVNVYASSAASGALSKVVAVLNDNDDEGPGHGDWRIRLEPAADERFAAWATAISAGQISQREFAELIDDRLDTIAEPAGAILLDVITTFDTNTAVRFASAINLGNGNRRITFTEDESQESGAAGNLTVPDRIILRLPIYQGGPVETVNVGVRYRVANAALTVSLRMLDIAETFEAANDNYLAPLVDAGLTVVAGSR